MFREHRLCPHPTYNATKGEVSERLKRVLTIFVKLAVLGVLYASFICNI